MDPNNIEYFVVHCSATKPDMDIGAKEIREWHRDRGWKDIGYHFVIRRNGRLELGRSLREMGAHVKGHNDNSWGICLIGGLDEENEPVNNFNPFQFITLQSLLETLYRLSPKAKVMGHRNFPDVAKECPCFDVIDWWHKCATRKVGKN